MNRRQFLADTMRISAAGLLLPSLFRPPSACARGEGLPGTKLRPAPSFDGRVVVVLELAGGNDGLNTVIPLGQGRYYDLRPNLGIPEEDVLPLTDTTGLHPALAPLLVWWKQGRMTVVHGVGYPGMETAHERARDIWMSAALDPDGSPGWIARLLESRLSGRCVWETQPGSDEKLVLARTVDRGHRKATVALEAKERSVPPYPAHPLGQRMRALGDLLAAGCDAPFCLVRHDGFDTHEDQLSRQAVLLRELAESVDAFLLDMERQGSLDRVLVMTTSEFGRRPDEDGAFGTEHGTAAAHLLLGGTIGGGIVGSMPDLGDLDAAGELPVQHDFRSVYTTVIERHLGANRVYAEEALRGSFPILPLLPPLERVA